MTQHPYDFEAFIDRMMKLQWHQMIPAAETECADAEHASYVTKGAVAARAAGSVEFAERLKAFLFWLRYGKRPFRASDYDWAKYRTVCEHLVQIGNFKPEALNDWND